MSGELVSMLAWELSKRTADADVEGTDGEL
jgi:hypothetical protein